MSPNAESSIPLEDVASERGSGPRHRVATKQAGRPPVLGRSVSLILRRTHMYIGLFVTPWLVMYALSTVVFNHAAQIDKLYKNAFGPNFDQYIIEKQSTYDKSFPPEVSPRARAERILGDLQLNGSFGVENAADRLIITRRDPFNPRRITWYPGTKSLVVERQASRVASILTTLHTQVSHTNKLKSIKAWAISVDMSIGTMLILVFSGNGSLDLLFQEGSH